MHKKLAPICLVLILIVILCAVALPVSALNEQQKLTASDGAPGDSFGASVSISGNTALISGPRAAYVFRYDGSTWVEEQKLTPSDPSLDYYFAYSVSIGVNAALIGAIGMQPEIAGCAYVFRYDGSTWVEEQKLTASDGHGGDWFGDSVSIDGDSAVIGAYYHEDSTGSAYVFRYDGSTWVEEEKLTASDGAAGDLFGHCASISGDAVLIGAPSDEEDAGSAYVFRYDGSNWVEEQKLTASDGAADDWFGLEGSISSNTALVGACHDEGWIGAAYVFRYDGSNWVEEQKLTASDGAVEDGFGFSVSISGNTALIGAYGDDDVTGSAYGFRYDGSTWVEEEKLTASDGDAGDRFGYSVSVSGKTALIGAYYDEDYAGSAYIFQLLDYDLFTLEPSLGLDAKGSEQTFEVFYDGVKGFPPGYDLEVEWVCLPGYNLGDVGTPGSGADVVVTDGGKPGIGELPPTPTEPTNGNDDFVTILSLEPGDCRIKLYVNGVEVALAEQKWGELYRSVLDVDADTSAVDHEVWEDTNVCNLISENVTATYLEMAGPQPAGSALVHWWLVEDSEENQEWIRNLMNDIAAMAGVHGYVDDWTATGRYDPSNTPKDQIMAWASLNQLSHSCWSDCQNQAFNPMGDEWIECQKVNDYYGWSTTTDNMPYQDHSIFYATLSNEDQEDVLIVTMVEYQTDYDGENSILIQIGEKHFGEPWELTETLIDEIDITDLPEGIRTSLTASLDVTMKKLSDSSQKNDVAAINALKAFINKVEALRGKKIPEELADELIANAQDIIEILYDGS
jgi:hypothetical protein